MIGCRHGWFGALMLAASSLVAGAAPFQVPSAPAIATFNASVLPKGLSFPSGCANPAWNESNPLTCRMPIIDGYIYDGPRNPSWDNAGVWSKWVIKTTQSITPIVGIHVAQVPGTESFLFVGRSSDLSLSAAGDIVAGVYDFDTNKYRNLTLDTNPFCGGVTLTHDGRIAVVGGTTPSADWQAPDGRLSLRLYDQKTNPNKLPTIRNMTYQRWYPSVTLLADNNLLIMGGTTTATETATPVPWFEEWDAAMAVQKFPIEPTFVPQMGKQFYPSVFVLPTSEVFVLQDQHSRIIKTNGEYRNVTAPGTGQTTPLEAPLYPAKWKTQFPHIGSAVMTALAWQNDYASVDIVMFGGSPTPDTEDEAMWCPSTNNWAKTTVANGFSYRLTISWTPSATEEWVYKFTDWIEEPMGIPRVGGDTVMLPNGDAVLLHGAQTGCSCGFKKGVMRGNYPALWPLLYQPDKPKGKRYTVLAASTIARMYHGTAVMTTDGTILVQGCDACDKTQLVSTAAFWNGSDTSRYEFRVEEFFPPYALDVAAKPKITAVNAVTDAATVVPIAYGKTFTITWAALPGANVTEITEVSLVAPSAVTHGFNTNQRVVFLKITKQAGNTLTVQVPAYASPTLGVLPPQIYKVFIMNGKTYSKAWWVKLAKPVPPATRRQLSARRIAWFPWGLMGF